MENWAKWADGARGGGGMLRDSTFLSSHLTNKRSLWACATTRTNILPHTAQRGEHTRECGRAPPPAIKRTRPAAAIISTTDAEARARTLFIPPPFPFYLIFFLCNHSFLCKPQQNSHGCNPPPTHKLRHNQKLFHHHQALKKTHTQASPLGSAGPDWEHPVMNCLMCSTESAAKKTDFFLAGHMQVWICMGICHTGNKHYIYMMPKVTSVKSEISSLLGIRRHVSLCLEGVGRLWIMLMCERSPWLTFRGQHWLRSSAIWSDPFSLEAAGRMGKSVLQMHRGLWRCNGPLTGM